MKDFTVKVPGVNFELSSNSIYHIREVSDANAPSGYQSVGIRKHPLPQISEGIVVPYDEGTETWNTGFFEKSKCYLVEGERSKEIFKKIKDNLLPELSALVYGDLTNGKSTNEQNKLFDEFTPFNGKGYGEDVTKYKIKGGNMFNTSNPLEFLAIWWALIGKQIMPESEKNSPSYKNCSYVIEDKKRSTTMEQEKEFDKSIAIATVMSIIKNKEAKEINHLQNIFEYLGINIKIEETGDKALISMFNKWCEKGGYNNENAAEFNEIYEKFEKEESREELVVYVKLISDIKQGKVAVERRDIIVDGKNLGSDKKSAARKIVKDKELHKAFLLIE